MKTTILHPHSFVTLLMILAAMTGNSGVCSNPFRYHCSAFRALQDYKGTTRIYAFNKNGDSNPARSFVLKVVSSDPEDWNQNTLLTSLDGTPPE
jgi:hypothetical protein